MQVWHIAPGFVTTEVFWFSNAQRYEVTLLTLNRTQIVWHQHESCKAKKRSCWATKARSARTHPAPGSNPPSATARSSRAMRPLTLRESRLFHASPHICATKTPRANRSRCGKYVEATCYRTEPRPAQKRDETPRANWKPRANTRALVYA